jgi:hypothetical protein
MIMENIWYDAEAYRGVGKGENDSDTGYNAVAGPENKRECPCDTCPMNLECLTNATECSAMRNWCSKGDFTDKDLMRLVRKCA